MPQDDSQTEQTPAPQPTETPQTPAPQPAETPADTPTERYRQISDRYGEKTGHKIDVTLRDRTGELDKTQKALQKAQQAFDDAPIGKEEKAEKALEKARKAYEEAKAELDSWKAVKEEHDKIVQAKAKARAEQDALRNEQAVEEERQRQAEEIAKREEQAERGAHAVHPAIREKWDAAPKIEGAENEITLANGERIKGRYVLVESGAATPSHNPSMEFVPYEGFPVDENGQTVNDRDYERDKEAQDITRQTGANYDSRALQSVPVVSNDGVVLSGNGRTMAGELAARDNTDGAYIDHLRKYPQQFGFTSEQVAGMQHPRVLFVPDEPMPYTTETFAKFNQQDMKSQSRTEQSVKLGKTVDDATFNRVIRSINSFDTIGDFYNDTKASTEAISELRNAGAINSMQYAEMFDGEKISGIGRQMLENMLIGKAFESNPDAIRQLAEYPSMRQSVISALAEISTNVGLGEEYSLESELAEAIGLAYQARKNGYKAGDLVSDYARQLNLFPFDMEETVADYTNATVLMLADVLNDNRTSILKKTLTMYNHAASESASGQMDIFSGSVKDRKEIIKDVLNTLNYGTQQEQQAALTAAAERRKAEAAEQSAGSESLQQDGTDGEIRTRNEEANTEVPSNDGRGSDGSIAGRQSGDLAQTENVEYQLSDEVDENGHQFVLNSDGNIEFGRIGEETGLISAPILLSEGEITNPKTNAGYGLLHIEARHGEQIRAAGYGSVLEFIEEVAKNYEVIRKGNDRDGRETYMLQLTDKHNNTLMVELSGDGTYWNINTAGIFKTSYGANRTVVYNRHTTANQPAETDEASLSGEQSGTTPSTRMNAPAQAVDVSAGKGSEQSAAVQGKGERLAENQSPSEPNAVQSALAVAEQETNTKPTEAQKEAGNYKKGHVKIDGYDVTIENPKGSVRRGTDASGKQWEQEMQNTYGYIRGTEGVDGDHIDVFFSEDPSQGDVFVVDQVNKDGSFDEHKVMYGFPDIESARKAYLSNYEDGWQGLGAITPVSKEEFKKWIDSSHRKTKPFAEYSSVKPLGDTQLGEQPNKPTVKAGEDYVSAAERIAKEHEVKRTAAHFAEETREEAAAFDKRVPKMDDAELLAYMQADGNGNMNKASHPSVYDEYDYRHGDEQLQSYDDTLVRLNESNTTPEQAEEMLANIHGNMERFATEERPLLLGQEEALQEYIDRLKNMEEEKEVAKWENTKEPEKQKSDTDSPSPSLSEHERITRDALIDLMRESGMEVITDVEEAQRVLDKENGVGTDLRLMGSRVESRKSEIAEALKDKKMTEEQRAVVSVFTGKKNNVPLIVTDMGGKERRVVMRQGHERRAGTKHSIFGHYGTSSNGYTAEEILLIPDVIKNGKRKQDESKGISYSYERDGVKYTVTTEIKGKGELFTNFYTNRKPTVAEQGTQNTDEQRVQPQQSVSPAKLQKVSEPTKERPTFYSNAERAVEGIRQEKATPEQWLAMIQKVGGLKAGEDKWLGLSDWLKDSKEKTLTKQQVLDFINENMIEVEEVHYSETEDQELFADYKREYKEYYDQAAAEGEDDPQDVAWQRMVDEHGDDFELGFYAYGDELHWDDDNDYINYEKDQIGADRKINETRLRFITSGLENNKEIALTVPTIESWNSGDEVHFGDAGEGRAVAWVRFGETTDTDGNRVLVIDEIQSKRHQEGREKGYITESKKKRAALRDFRQQLLDKYNTLHLRDVERQATKEELQKLKELDEAIVGVPVAPFEKNWHELAMKRMLRYAAENGYDKVAWTKGEQQAERYDLSKVIDEIAYWKEGDGLWGISAGDRRDSQKIDQQTFTEKELIETFGKEIAERILNDEGVSESVLGYPDDPNVHYLNGETIKIGGEGMKGFYDKMLPSFMNKYGKKWNVKVGEVELPEVEEAGRKMWSVDVTPEMKASVKEGQPMFFRTSDGTAYGFTKNGKTYIDPRIATSETPLHEYAHLWAQALRGASPKAWEQLKEQILGKEDVRQYVQRLYPELHGDSLAEEIFTTFAGRRGQQRLQEEREKMLKQTGGIFGRAQVIELFDRIRRAVRQFWNMARDLFSGRMPDSDLSRLSAEDFADMMTSDLMNGFDPSQIKSATDNIGSYDPQNTDIRYSRYFGGNSGYVGENGDIRYAKKMEIGRGREITFTKKNPTGTFKAVEKYLKDLSEKEPDRFMDRSIFPGSSVTEKVSVNRARTGSNYIGTTVDNVNYEFRFANHTKSNVDTETDRGIHADVYEDSDLNIDGMEVDLSLADLNKKDVLSLMDEVNRLNKTDIREVRDGDFPLLSEYGILNHVRFEKKEERYMEYMAAKRELASIPHQEEADIKAMIPKGENGTFVSSDGYELSSFPKEMTEESLRGMRLTNTRRNIKRMPAERILPVHPEEMARLMDEYNTARKQAEAAVSGKYDERRRHAEEIVSEYENNILFSEREQDAVTQDQRRTATKKTLMGVHNISEEKLRKAIRQGGLANPSLAVIDTENGIHSDFGDISLIPKSTLIDSETGRNAGTYTGDAWTSTYPHVTRRLTKQGDEHIDRMAKEAAKGDKELEYHLRSNLRNYIEGANDITRMLYLIQKGIEPEIVPQRTTHSQDEFDAIQKIFGEGTTNMPTDMTKEQNDALLDLMVSTYEKKLREKENPSGKFYERIKELNDKRIKEYRDNLTDENGKIWFAKGDTFVFDNWRDEKRRKEGTPDWYWTDNAARDKVTKEGLTEDFEKWKEGLFGEGDIEEVLFAGFDRDGNRKYLPNTLANASLLMNKEADTNAYNNGGLNATRSSLLKKMLTLSAIRKNKNLLQGEDKYEEKQKEMSDKLFGIIEQVSDMQQISDNKFSNIDYAEARLQEAITRRDPVAYLNKEYGYHIDKDGELAKEIADFKKEASNLPVKYFETKFRRPVGLNEFSVAVVPENTSADVVKALQDAGLDVRTYDGTEEDRKAVTLEAVSDRNDVLFREESTKDSNDKFNKFLGDYMKGDLKRSDVLRIPNNGSLSLYLPNSKDILLRQSVINKAHKKHNISLESLFDLPEKLHHPILVFKSSREDVDGVVVLIDAKDNDGNNVVVAINLSDSFNEIEVNDITSMYGKDSYAGYAAWSKNILSGDEEKLKAWIASLPDNDKRGVSKSTLSKLAERLHKVLSDAAKLGNYSETETPSSAETVGSTATETGEKLGVKVRLIHSREELPKEWTEKQKRNRRGWYDTRTGEIAIVVPNNADAGEVVRTLLHEAVGHKGLRELFGEDFDIAMDNIYHNVTEEIREQIDDKARQKGWNTNTATEEYLSSLAEDANYEAAKKNGTWAKIKNAIIEMLRRAGLRLGVKLTDADLRYILWRSHENMTENGRRGVFGEAKDAAMREKLGVNNASEALNERFSEREEEGSDRSLFEQQLLALDKLAESHKENLNIRRMAIEAMNGQMKVSAIFFA